MASGKEVNTVQIYRRESKAGKGKAYIKLFNHVETEDMASHNDPHYDLHLLLSIYVMTYEK
jgi:hypothetical protein